MPSSSLKSTQAKPGGVVFTIFIPFFPKTQQWILWIKLFYHLVEAVALSFYIQCNAVFKLLRKSQEIDPKKLKDLQHVTHSVIDSAKDIVGKKDYFDVVNYLSTSVESLRYTLL